MMKRMGGYPRVKWWIDREMRFESKKGNNWMAQTKKRSRSKEMEEREGGQGPPRSATGKTAINNLHHLSLCAPLDHSTNSTRNLRQKHTLARMQRFVCARSCINTHADTNVCVCMQVAAESRYNSPLHPESNSLLTQPLLSFRTWPQTSTHHTERVAQGPAFCLCGGHVKLMPVCHC